MNSEYAVADFLLFDKYVERVTFLETTLPRAEQVGEHNDMRQQLRFVQGASSPLSPLYCSCHCTPSCPHPSAPSTALAISDGSRFLVGGPIIALVKFRLRGLFALERTEFEADDTEPFTHHCLERISGLVGANWPGGGPPYL